MPLLKKSPPQSGRILPKIESDLSMYGASYSFNTGKLSPPSIVPSGISYSMIIDSDGTQILTSDHDSDSADVSFSRPRKRQRLDHLSQEEKVMRRKLKNRVAAQSARDRKKAKMTELEEQVSELESEKQFLAVENCQLRNINQVLEKENLELKQRLGLIDSNITDEEVPVAGRKVAKQHHQRVEEEIRSVGHAEGTGSEDSCSLDDAIRLLASSSETDDLLSLLQQCGEDLLHCDISTSHPDNSVPDRETKKELSNDEVVGPTAKGLESLKELIHFDHIYFKQDAGLLPQQSVTLSTEEPNPEMSNHVDIQEDIPTIVISSEAPVVCVHPPEDTTIAETATCLNSNAFSQPALDKDCLSPALSDAGYDSSFSANSPVSFNDPWDETFTELFPTLV